MPVPMCICKHSHKDHAENGGECVHDNCGCTTFEEMRVCECGHQRNHHHPDHGGCVMNTDELDQYGDNIPCACAEFKPKT